MYIIINQTEGTTITHVGNFPGQYLDWELNAGNKVIVISTYSNTIKVPRSETLNGIVEWIWEDYNIDSSILIKKEKL